jgi:hypothetical protein
MSGIYQKQVNSSTVNNPSSGSTFLGIDETGKLFTKSESGQVTVQNTQTIHHFYLLDVISVFGNITSPTFSVGDWTSSYILEFPVEFVNNGISDVSGNFTDEPSSFNVIGISVNEDHGTKESSLVNYSVRFTGGSLLDSYEQSTSVRLGGFDNIEYTYKYEENGAATGTDPKHIHDFRINIDSTQILGYVLINADDSESHNFIIDSAGN